MDEEFLREVASQLRKPNGEFGKEVASKMNESNRLMNIRAIESLKIRDFDSLLEIGMANGAFVHQIIKSAKGIRYTGIDYSLEMVELAKLNNQQLMDSEIVEFKLGDISKLPHLSESVDKIFTVNTIYFWDQPDLAFKECKRVLKSNGLLAIAIRPESCLKKYPSTKFNFKHYTIKDVEELLAKHGFDIDSIIKESEPKTEVLEEIITPEFAVIIGRKLS